MKNYEKITQSAESLARFLKSLPILDGPWDEMFEQRYCGGCHAERFDWNCNKNCPHKAERHNPMWWLEMEESDNG